jgi:hypothetical protein
VEVDYRGTVPYTSTTMDVVIWGPNQTKLCLTRIDWGQTWLPPTPSPAPRLCKIDGIKRILETPSLVRFEVQYSIDPTHPVPVHIGAYIPNHTTQQAGFSIHPAINVPKGTQAFSDRVIVEVAYHGPLPVTTSTLEVVLYDGTRNLCSQVINWGQVWRAAEVPR